MKCKDCKFYRETIPRDQAGVCLVASMHGGSVQLPAWVEKTEANIVSRDEGCTLGQQDDEL